MLPNSLSSDEETIAPANSQKRQQGNINHAYVNSLTQDDVIPAIPIKTNSTSFEIKATNSMPSQDIINTIIGDFGIWQLRTVLIIFLCKIPAAWFMACIIYTAPELYPGSDFQCDKKALPLNHSISADQCYVYHKVGKEFFKERCKQFVYKFDFDSLIMQFDLVCFRDIFIAWTQYWHLFGVLLGGVIGTKMMIWISPRNIYFIGQITQIICGIATGYARDFNLHCAARCLSAICCALMFTSGQAIFTDITAGIHRTGAIILYDTFWSIGVILLPTLSSWFNSWTYIYLGITFPTILLTLLLQWTPDSPRWLLKNGSDADVDRVEQSIREAAEINERIFKIPNDFRNQLELLRDKLRNAPPPVSWKDLWHGSYHAKTNMIAAHIALAAFIINFMGMLLNIRSFGRQYLLTNTVVMGFSEIVGCFLALHFTLKHNKWKWQYAGIFNVVAGLIGCLGWIFSSNDIIDPLVKVTLWMIIAIIPKAAVSCAQSMMYACLNELMPPNKKIPFVFSVVTWARVWLLTAPFLNVLKKVDTALSLSSYSILSIIGGIFTCLLLTPRNTSPRTSIVLKTQKTLEKDESRLQQAVWTVSDNGLNSSKL